MDCHAAAAVLFFGCRFDVGSPFVVVFGGEAHRTGSCRGRKEVEHASVRAQSLRGSNCKLECGVLNVDDSGQYDRGEVGSGDGMSGALRFASREQDLPIGSGDV